MFIVMILLAGAFVLFGFYFARTTIAQFEQKEQEEFDDLEQQRQALEKEKEIISIRKDSGKKEASEIFTLYDMTKEISKKFSEQEAFEVFRSTLTANIKCEDCRFVRSEGDRRKEMPSQKDYFIFPLQGRRRVLGHIAIKGLAERDKNKFIILAQQFGLALRRVILYQEVEESATTDSLTGVHTRRYLMERFNEEIERASAKDAPLSFLMIDVDLFKGFNDKYGHLVGDQILRGVSLLIQENIREIDYVGRYGGEEFSVVLPDTDSEGGFFVAERIRRAIAGATIKAYDTSVQATVSIGISTFPSDGKSSLEMIDKSDWALYRSKKRGRNCVTAFGIHQDQ